MTLSAEQRQALREKAASARTQGKLVETRNPEETAEVVRQFHEENVSRETFSEADKEAAFIAAHDGPPPFFPAFTRVEDIPWEEDTPSSSREVAIRSVESSAIVEGFSVEGLTLEQIEDLTEQVYTYIGVEPRHIGQYTGRKLRMIGSVAVPLEGDVLDKNTGEVRYVKWVQPRFKLASKDDVTGENVILYGGGKNGLAFVRLMTSLYGPGDWKSPKEVTITMQVRDNSHVLYHFMHKRVKGE